MVYQWQGFTVEYDGKSIVTVRRNVQPEAFEGDVHRAQAMLRNFKRSKLGSDWGCDGVGYHAQLMRGEVECHRSGVGPINFRHGWLRMTGTVPA